ncbi:MAG TPA: hypothetical protein VK012_02885 [Gemmatimonadales bacterium]|nr:hypothetical protein [Gemmatimonadales bacterium]
MNGFRAPSPVIQALGIQALGIHTCEGRTMARNISKDYATMDEDERRRFAQLPKEGEAPSELDLEEPRDESAQGHSQIDQERETADPEHRDGLAAELDDTKHEKRARRKRS